MDVTRMLEADHRDVEDLFEKISKAKGAKRTPLIDELVTSLEAHMELEETTLYPAVKPVIGGEEVEEGETEHDLARHMVKDLLALAPDEPGFGAALDALKAGIEHHVQEEEDDMFPEVRTKAAKELEKVATPFMAKRMELGLPMEAPALSAAFSKDELATEADKAGLDVKSDMTKDQLAEALAGAMA